MLSENIDRLNRDRPGGHSSSFLSDGGIVGEKGRRSAKKLDKKKARREHQKILTEALLDYEEDCKYYYQDCGYDLDHEYWQGHDDDLQSHFDYDYWEDESQYEDYDCWYYHTF